MRPVIDLSTLNTFVENSHFHMENWSSIKSLLRSGNFMTKLDLQDAFLTVATDPLLYTEISSVYLERHSISTPSPPIWAKRGSTGIYKTPQVSGSFLTETGHSFCVISQRYANNWLQVSGNGVVHSSSYRPSHCFELQRPQREVNNNSNSGNCLPQLHRQTSRKSEENSHTLPTNSYGRRCISPHASSATGCARVSSTSGVEPLFIYGNFKHN